MDETYVFARWLVQGPAEQARPRGGSTQGAPVQLERAASASWQAIHAEGISAQERDRRAILAMAGSFRVSFEFRETVAFGPGAVLDRPYRSWATEVVLVIHDSPERVSLQHVLQMYFVKDGKEVGPVVMKHWRQDWQYEPATRLAYVGDRTWKRIPIAMSARKGRWSQSAYQVDDTPRYSAIGRWQHHADFSEWVSERGARPLPRREYSIRSDYDALLGTHTHVVQATGWTHEQNNLKAVLKAGRAVRYLAREIGLSRYQRIQDFDTRPARRYWSNTAAYWQEVRQAWQERIAKHATFRVLGQVNGQRLYEAHFAFADTLSSHTEQATLKEHANRTIEAFFEARAD
ncbi:MAG: DUF6607 family protein [Polyangiales bacterium]